MVCADNAGKNNSLREECFLHFLHLNDTKKKVTRSPQNHPVVHENLSVSQPSLHKNYAEYCLVGRFSGVFIIFLATVRRPQRRENYFAICIILPLPLENPTCYSLWLKTDLVEVVVMKRLSKRQRQIAMLMMIGKCPKRYCPHVIHSTINCL